MKNRVYLPGNVLIEARRRIARLFDDFPHVIVATSGGKDSTVVFHLAMEEATRRGRLPLDVMWLDQEAEYGAVVEYQRAIMNRPDVRPHWFQIPIKIENASSSDTPWMTCWEPGVKWMRPKEPNSIHENTYGYEEFNGLFNRIVPTLIPEGERGCLLGGLRCEESPNRFVGLTTRAKWKEITWAKTLDAKREIFTFYPIYDWTAVDVWKAIHEHGWPYCPVYDAQYQKGVTFQNMRVSSLHHATAVRHLFHLQEIDRDTHNALSERLPGTNSTGHLGQDDFYLQKKLPFMFRDWREYRDFLTEKLITNEEHRAKFQRCWARMDREWADYPHQKQMIRRQINAILNNDHALVKMGDYENGPPMIWRKEQRKLAQQAANRAVATVARAAATPPEATP